VNCAGARQRAQHLIFEAVLTKVEDARQAELVLARERGWDADTLQADGAFLRRIVGRRCLRCPRKHDGPPRQCCLLGCADAGDAFVPVPAQPRIALALDAAIDGGPALAAAPHAVPFFATLLATTHGSVGLLQLRSWKHRKRRQVTELFGGVINARARAVQINLEYYIRMV
jgi:hypothetical protein